jgi:DNA-binding beta-propeller fold protein YncE
MTSWRGRARVGVAVVAALALGGCDEFVGIEPPQDGLFFPTGIAVHPTGRYVYVVNSNFDVAFSAERGGTVAVVDADTLRIVPEATVRIGSFGGQAVLSSDARFLYVAVRGDDSVVRLEVSEDGGRLSCNGGLDGLPCRFEELDRDPYALVVETYEPELEVGGRTRIDLLTVTHLRTNAVTSLSFRDENPATARRVQADLTSGGSALAIHPRTGDYYVSARFESRVRIIRPVLGREGEVVGIFSLGSIALNNPTGSYDARDIAFSASGDRAYVAARNPHAVLVLDTSPNDNGTGARNAWIAAVDLDEPPEALVVVSEPAGEMVYVLELGAETVTVVDARNALVLGRFRVGEDPAAMAVDLERHRRMYVTLFGEGALGVVDLDPESRRYRTTVAKVR